MATKDPIVSFDHVTKSYPQGEVALDDLSFSIEEGEFVCVIGPSGCGKSTVLKVIARLEEPTSGHVLRPEHVAMVFQSGALFPWLSALENVAVGLRAEGESESRIQKEAIEHLALLGLADYAQKFPRELSGGQRQRVGIARALAVKPAVLLLDEPFSALDPKTTHYLHEDLVKLWKQTGITIVMVSHLIEEAVSLAQKVLLMHESKVVETFPIDISYPRHDQGVAVLGEVQKIRRAFFK